MAAQYRNYYEILGVAKTATLDEIRSAFRKLARKYHPDVAKDKKASEEKFKEINEAYEVLGDEEKRRKYDEFGAHWQAGGQGFPPGGMGGGWQTGGDPRGGGGAEYEFGGTTGFSDFFEQLFGGQRAGGRANRGWGGNAPARAMRGEDIESDLLVSIEDAVKGATRQITLRRTRGKTDSYTVKIPKGVRQGQRIRLAGAGSPGHGGGEAGDLYMRVRYERHPYFEISGSDIIHRIEIAAWDAVLGCTVEVPTLEGVVRLKIPAGAQPNQKLRIAGRGLPTESLTRGDYYAIVEISLPRTSMTPEEIACWQKIAALHK